MFSFVFVNLILILYANGISSRSIEQIIIPTGDSFSFDCKPDDYVYFARQLGGWTHITDGDYRYPYINFLNLDHESILRITITSAQEPHVGFYGCRNSVSKSKSMHRIYQLVLADVESFYWSYVCRGPIDSCSRSDDPRDKTSSTLVVAENTKVDLFCCASVTGYDNVNILTNKVGQSHGRIEIKRRKDLDGSLVICATQHTTFQRRYSNSQEQFKCELVIDEQSYSTLSATIEVQDELPPDSDSASTDDNTSHIKNDPDYGEDTRSGVPTRTGQGKVKSGAKIAAICGSIAGGFVVLGLSLFLILFLYRKKKAVKKSTTKEVTKEYSTAHTDEPSNTYYEVPSTDDQDYLKPIPLDANYPPIVIRL